MTTDVICRPLMSTRQFCVLLFCVFDGFCYYPASMQPHTGRDRRRCAATRLRVRVTRVAILTAPGPIFAASQPRHNKNEARSSPVQRTLQCPLGTVFQF